MTQTEIPTAYPGEMAIGNEPDCGVRLTARLPFSVTSAML